jgi:hypothetical protein
LAEVKVRSSSFQPVVVVVMGEEGNGPAPRTQKTQGEQQRGSPSVSPPPSIAGSTEPQLKHKILTDSQARRRVSLQW